MSSSEPPSPVALDGCRNLSRARESYCKTRNPQDALCAFLGIHECICLAVERSSSEEIIRLNSHFANLCVKVHYRYHYRQGRQFGWLWSFALEAYDEEPNAIARLLPLMAAAHIIEDLPNAIYDCYPVSKDEYNAVFYHIVDCVEATRKSHQISRNAWGRILRQFRRNAPINDTLVGLVLAFGTAVAWLPPFLNPGINKMRDVAWRIAQAKRKISQRP